MKKYMNAYGDIFDEQELWDTFMEDAEDFTDEEFECWLCEVAGVVEV